MDEAPEGPPKVCKLWGYTAYGRPSTVGLVGRIDAAQDCDLVNIHASNPVFREGRG